MDAMIRTWICFLITTAVCSTFYATNVGGSADTYLGCYNEYTSESVFVIPTSNEFNGSTPVGCREGCRKDQIYSFAGLWGGYSCQCASGLNEERIRPVDNSLCYRRCPAESVESCGGSNTSYTFSVYSVCPRGFYGRSCTDKCNCKDNRSCTVHGMCPGDECAAGWRLNNTIPNRSKCSIDVNECQAMCGPNLTNSIICHNCSSLLHQECKNTEGSFTCICEDGYRKTEIGTCSDIDECAKGTHKCSQFCNNTEGDYNCSCQPGYELQGRFDCKEIDECAVNATNCQHACINMDGSYYCVCQPGYQLHYDRHSCVDVDECQTPCSSQTTTKCYQCEQSYECRNTIGSFECRCKSGFVFHSDQKTCEDIDECSQQMANCSHTCTNTNGGYKCGCLEGFELESDSHHCVGSRLWSPLAVYLGLGNGVQFIIIVVLAITVCTLLAGRKIKKLQNTGIEPEEDSCTKLFPPNDNYAPLDKQQATGSRPLPHNEYDRLSHPKANGSRPLPPNAYAPMHSPLATGSRPHAPGTNEIANTVDHPQELQEDAYFEIA